MDKTLCLFRSFAHISRTTQLLKERQRSTLTSILRIFSLKQSEVLKKRNLTELIEERRKNRTAIEKSARKNVGDEMRCSKDRLTNALTQLQHAWSEQVRTSR